MFPSFVTSKTTGDGHDPIPIRSGSEIRLQFGSGSEIGSDF